MRFPFTASRENISVFFSGRMHSVPSTSKYFADLLEHLKGTEHDSSVIELLVDKPTLIARMTARNVSVIGRTVYFKGVAVNNTLTTKLVNLIDMGFDAQPWALFMDRLMDNPSERSRECLYNFLDHFNAPITEDGMFIGFKRVNGQYKDIYTGKFDNSPGMVVEMPRSSVNPDPNVSCSYGLHVAASAYMGSTYGLVDGYKVIAVKVDPADVVAVPTDYGFAKMRVCRYTVIGDAEEGFVEGAENVHVYKESAPSYIYNDEEEEDDCNNYCEECGDLISGDVSLCFDCYSNGPDDYDGLSDDDAEDESDDEPVETEPSEMAFTRKGVTYSASQITAGLSAHGQRGYARLTGVPRTTLQDWKLKIDACA